MQSLIDPIAFLASKAGDAAQRISTDDPPVLALSSPEGIYLATKVDAKGNRKIITLAEEPEVVVAFAGRGDPSDLSELKDLIRQAVNLYARRISPRDLSGRLISSYVTMILREYMTSMEIARALAVHVVIADPLDQEFPFCAISSSGNVCMGNNFVLEGQDIKELGATFRTFKHMQTYAHQFFSEKGSSPLQDFSFFVPREKKQKQKRKSRPK